MTPGVHVYILYGLLVGLIFAIWRMGRRIDALEEALENQRDARRLARSRDTSEKSAG